MVLSNGQESDGTLVNSWPRKGRVGSIPIPGIYSKRPQGYPRWLSVDKSHRMLRQRLIPALSPDIKNVFGESFRPIFDSSDLQILIFISDQMVVCARLNWSPILA